jgi:hypothetical protein
MPIPTWPRPLHEPGGSAADLVFQVFARGPLPPELPLDRERHGLPEGDAPDGIYLSVLSAEDAPGWFARFGLEPRRSLVAAQLGEGMDELLAADHCYEVAGEEGDPSSLAYLQHAWGVVRCLVEQGGGPVLDRHAHRWWSREEILALAPDRAFDVRREVTAHHFDAGKVLGSILFTRGLAKLGQPDVVMVQCGPDDLDALFGLAEAVALGLPVGPGYELAGEDGSTLHFVAYEPDDLMPDLKLENEALVVVRRA